MKIKNWHKFQHYKHRNPPWIKLHREILTSEDWTMLDDASKLLAIVCMVIAAGHDGDVPNNPAYIKRVAYLDKIPNLKPLIQCGFLLETLADASIGKQLRTNADTETETETETEKKEVLEARTMRAHRNGTRLGDEWTPDEEGYRFATDVLGSHSAAQTEFEKFRDYWKAKPGQSARKLDWPATWRNWIRNSKGKTNGSHRQRLDDEIGQLADEARRLERAAGISR